MRPPIDRGVVLLTGASSGIGLALARQIAPRAAGLALVARRADKLDALAESLRAAYPSCNIVVKAVDLSVQSALEPLIEAVEAELGPITVLINNAGLGDIGLFERSDAAKNQQIIDVNIGAVTRLTRLVIPSMIARERGGVLFISSGYGLHWMPFFATYAASKAYVTNFSEILRAELTGTGVVVTQSCPGPVRTEFNEVAGMPDGLEVPGIISIDADKCARHTLAAFDAGRALTVPGTVMAIATHLSRLVPWWVMRIIYGGLARLARARM